MNALLLINAVDEIDEVISQVRQETQVSPVLTEKINELRTKIEEVRDFLSFEIEWHIRKLILDHSPSPQANGEQLHGDPLQGQM